LLTNPTPLPALEVLRPKRGNWNGAPPLLRSAKKNSTEARAAVRDEITIKSTSCSAATRTISAAASPWTMTLDIEAVEFAFGKLWQLTLG
jgi:hypothetical protein